MGVIAGLFVLCILGMLAEDYGWPMVLWVLAIFAAAAITIPLVIMGRLSSWWLLAAPGLLAPPFLLYGAVVLICWLVDLFLALSEWIRSRVYYPATY